MDLSNLPPLPKKVRPNASLEHRENLKKAAQARWARYREEHAARDEAIVRMYEEGYGYQRIAKVVGVNKSTVKNILVYQGVIN